MHLSTKSMVFAFIIVAVLIVVAVLLWKYWDKVKPMFSKGASIASGFTSIGARSVMARANAMGTNLALPPSGETVITRRSGFRPLVKTNDQRLNNLAMEGMTGKPSGTSYTGGDQDSDLSPFNDTVDRNEILSNIALTADQRRDHRDFVKKRMVYARTANSPDESLEYIDANWRGLRMPRAVSTNKTNPSQTIEIANEQIFKDISNNGRRI